MQLPKSRLLYFTEILSYTSFWFCSNKIFISSKTCRTRSSLSNIIKKIRVHNSGIDQVGKRSRDGNRLWTKFLFYCHWFILSMHLESYSYKRKETTDNWEVLLDLNYLTNYPSKLPRYIKEEFSAASIGWKPFTTEIQMQHEIDETCSSCPPISSSQLLTSPLVP